MRKLLPILLMLTLLPLSGCYDAVDLGEQIFAINLALDAGEGAALRLTVQYPQITPVGKQPAQGDGDLQKNGYIIEQVEGEDLNTCLELLHMVTPRRLSLMQLHGLYISETVARDQDLFHKSLSTLADAYSARPTALVHLTRGHAEDVLREQIPLFGARLSKAQAAQNDALQAQGIIPSAPLNLFYHYLTDPSRSAVAVLAAVNNMQYISTPSFRGVQSTAYLAGDLPRNTVDKVDLCGSAVFGENSMIFLDGYETQLYNILTGYLRRLDLTVDGHTTQIDIYRTPDIQVDLEGDTPRILVRLPVRCNVENAGAFTETLKQDVIALLLKLQQHGMDPIGIVDHARMHALTIADWQEMNWKSLYAAALFDVDIR